MEGWEGWPECSSHLVFNPASRAEGQPGGRVQWQGLECICGIASFPGISGKENSHRTPSLQLSLSLISSFKVRDKAQDSGVPKRNNLPLDPMNVVLCDVFSGLERMWESCVGKGAESFPVSEDGSSPAATTAETQELPLWAQGSNI